MADRLQDLQISRGIVQAGSLTGAGLSLGLSPATISGRVKAMEDFYGVPLLKRSTRALAVTEEGKLLLAKAEQILGEVEDLDTVLKERREVVSGSVKVTCPVDFGRQYMDELVTRFLARHEKVQINISLTDRLIVIVETGIDIAIRFGNLPDSSLMTRQLGPNRYVITVEEHNVLGGLGSAVAEVIAEEGLPVRVRRHGIADEYSLIAPPTHLYAHYKLDAAGIESVAETFLG
jgi:DNA-binding transcriptional LysR family regulator